MTRWLALALLLAGCDHEIQVGHDDGGADAGDDAGVVPTHKPLGVTFTVTAGVGSLTVTWEPEFAVLAVTKWHLLRATEDFTQWSSSLAGAEEVELTDCCSYTFDHLTPGETSYIEVRGINALGEGPGGTTPATPVAFVTSWSTPSPMPTPRYDLAAAGLDGKLYVVGGLSPSLLGTLEIFDPASGQWSTGAPMPTPRSQLAAVGVNGRLYAIGGFASGFTPSAAVEEYDPATDSWRTRASIPPATPACDGAPVAATLGGLIYVLIGECGLDMELLAYDPVNDAWSTRARGGGAVGAFALGLVPVGNNLWSMSEGAIQEYLPAQNVWLAHPGLSLIPGTFGTLASASGELLALVDNQSPPNELLYFDSGASAWVTLPQSTLARDRFATATVADVVYVVGGAPPVAPGATPVPLATLEAGQVLP